VANEHLILQQVVLLKTNLTLNHFAYRLNFSDFKDSISRCIYIRVGRKKRKNSAGIKHVSIKEGEESHPARDNLYQFVC